jgi:iron(III) transport system permease protein
VWRSVDTLTVLLFALPSTVIGIGLVSVWNRPGTAFVYGTPAIILLGYMAKYAAIGSRATVSALATIPPSMEEAARLAGAGWFRRIGGIIVPLAGHGLVVVWVLGFLFSLRDLGITMMVYPPGGDTLPVRTFTLMANGSPPLIASLSVIMVAVGLASLGLAALLLGRGEAPA